MPELSVFACRVSRTQASLGVTFYACSCRALVDKWLPVQHSGGPIRIPGGIKDMIIRGGENIYPREVE